MPDDARQLLRRSPASRAVVGILRQVRTAGCGGLTVPGLCFLLRSRYSPSTIAHATVSLRRLGVLVWTGAVIRTHEDGKAKVWRTA